MIIDATRLVLLFLFCSAASVDVRAYLDGDRESFERHFVLDRELFDESHGVELLMSVAPGPIEEPARENCRLDVTIAYRTPRNGPWGGAMALRGLLVADVVQQKFYIARYVQDDVITLDIQTVPGSCSRASFVWKVGLAFSLKEIFRL